MTSFSLLQRLRWLSVAGLGSAVGFALFPVSAAWAQIVPDDTLGAESSVVIPGDIDGAAAELIEGGATRESNLFHSFLEFNVGEGQRVYFASPLGIGSILSRVTGDNPSNIFGTLGVAGAADLFLVNPNGIVFGENATLNIPGSFYGTTADAIPLGNEGLFNATDPEQSTLLTVRPEVSFFNYLTAASGDIESRGALAAGENLTLAANRLDLQGQMAAGADLSLLGREAVQIRDAAAVPFIGFAGGDLLVQGNEQVDIVALSHPDSGLYSYGDMVLRSANPVGGDAHYWSAGNFRVETLDGAVGDLVSPVDPIIRAFGDVTIGAYQGSSLHILAGGSVTIGTAIVTAPDPGAIGVDFLQEAIELSDGTVVEVDGGAQPTLDVRAGIAPTALGPFAPANRTGFNPDMDTFFIFFGATDTPLSADIFVGDVLIGAANGLVLLTNQYEPNPELAGSIAITGDGVFETGINARGFVEFEEIGGTVYLDARNDVLVTNSIIQTSGVGNVGDIVINAEDTVRFEGQDRPTFVGSLLVPRAAGSAGDIRINTGTLEVLNGAQFSASTSGEGDAGNVLIEARDRVVFAGTSTDGQFQSAAISTVEESGTGSGGNVEITANSLKVLNGAQLSASTSGNADAGNVLIEARDRVVFAGTSTDGQFQSAAISRVEESGTGRGGNVEITANSLGVLDGAQLTASTLGNGNAGNVLIEARNRVVFADGAVAFSRVGESGIGRGGSVKISANSLEVLNGAQLQSATLGDGNAGNVEITVRESALFSGISTVGQFNSAAFSDVGESGTGQGGNVIITANSLEVLNGGALQAATLGNGDAGNIVIEVRDRVVLSGNNTTAFSNVAESGTGKGGNVAIAANSLEVLNGAQLQAATAGDGDAGNVFIETRDSVVFSGTSTDGQFQSAAISSVADGATGSGGNVAITADSLELLNGAGLTAATSGNGDAGNVIIEAREYVNLQGTGLLENPSAIFSSSESLATGQGGEIRVVTPNLSVQEGALLEASTLGTQNGGDIVLSLGRLTVLEGGQIVASSVGSGTAGTVRIDATESIQIAGRDATFADRAARIPEIADRANPESTISVQSRAEGAAGDIIIGAAGTTPEIILDDGGQIIAESAAVDGGNITLNLTDLLLLRNGSLISATAGTEQAGGNGGNITISVPFIIAIPEENSDIAADAFEGTGGNVTINARGVFGIEPRAQRTLLSDITASSELGITGTVNFNVLDTGFIEGSLNDLSGDLVSPEALTAGSCIARSDDTEGSFVVTGAEGLPQRPDGESVSAFPTGEVRAVADSSAATIREPDGVYQLADGRLVLGDRCH